MSAQAGPLLAASQARTAFTTRWRVCCCQRSTRTTSADRLQHVCGIRSVAVSSSSWRARASARSKPCCTAQMPGALRPGGWAHLRGGCAGRDERLAQLLRRDLDRGDDGERLDRSWKQGCGWLWLEHGDEAVPGPPPGPA